MRNSFAILSISVFAFTASSARASLINGSFEASSTPQYTYYSAGDPSIPGWTINSGGVGLFQSIYLNLPDDQGPQSLSLSGNAVAGSVSQITQATLGTIYNLSFDYAGWSDHPELGLGYGSSAGWTVTYQIFDGSSGATLYDGSYVLQTSDVGSWHTLSAQVMATSSLIGIRFGEITVSYGSDAYVGVMIDGVSLEPSVVPEPTSACLMLIAGATGACLHLRSRSARYSRF